jgi:hypothetical protein
LKLGKGFGGGPRFLPRLCENVKMAVDHREDTAEDAKLAVCPRRLAGTSGFVGQVFNLSGTGQVENPSYKPGQANYRRLPLDDCAGSFKMTVSDHAW